MTVLPSNPVAAAAGKAGGGGAGAASVGVTGTGVGTKASASTPGLVLSWTAVAGIVMLGVPFCVLFSHFFYVQNFQAMTNADWTHAYFVPIIAGFLLWSRREELQVLQPRVFWPGLIPIVLSIVCYAVFQLSPALNNHMLRGFAMLLCVFGMVLLLLGPRVARAMILPLGYLVFGVTLAEKIMREVTVPLRFIATEGSFALLNAIGISADRQGNVLEIQTATGVVPLNIADACAGMRMLIAFVALGAAVALLGRKHWWQRVFLLLLAVPVALLMNITRVAGLGVLTLWDPKLAQGESHMLVGYLFLIPAFLLFMAIAWALDRVIVEKPAKPANLPWWKPGPVNWRALARPGVLVCMGLLTTSALGLPATIRVLGLHMVKLPINAPDDRQVREIPQELPSWRRIGADVQESNESVEELGTRNYLTRQYALKSNASERPVILQVHIAYYTGMIDAVPHVPERCYVGAGFSISSRGTVTVPLKLSEETWRPHADAALAAQGIKVSRLPNQFSSAPGIAVTLPSDLGELGLRVTEFENPKDQSKHYAGYFFLANGGIATTAEGVRLKSFDFKNEYAYYCKVQVSGPAASHEDLAKKSESLLSELLPELMRCVPDWVQVEAGEYPADNPRRKRATK